MKLTHGTQNDLVQALEVINKKYDNNIIFNRLDGTNFTLKVKYSQKAGHRLGFPDYNTGKQRRLINACWHVHGYFFEALFEINPNAVIHSSGKKITKDYGN